MSKHSRKVDTLLAAGIPSALGDRNPFQLPQERLVAAHRASNDVLDTWAWAIANRYCTQASNQTLNVRLREAAGQTCAIDRAYRKRGSNQQTEFAFEITETLTAYAAALQLDSVDELRTKFATNVDELEEAATQEPGGSQDS